MYSNVLKYQIAYSYALIYNILLCCWIYWNKLKKSSFFDAEFVRSAFILNILFSKQHKFNDTCAFQIYTHWISFHHSKQNCISLSPWEFVTIMHLFYNWYLKLRLTNVFTFDIPFDVYTCLFSGNELISMCH